MPLSVCVCIPVCCLLFINRVPTPSVDDAVTLDLSIRRDATVDALLSLQSEPIDFSKKTSRDTGLTDDDADLEEASCRQ